jgi:uncharacterized protein
MAAGEAHPYQDTSLITDPQPMPDTPEPQEDLEIEAFNSMQAISAGEWDACAGADDPFVSHAFLSALETSQSASAETGWIPCPLVIRQRSDKQVIAAVPLYFKTHSQGEYVFDHGWANAFENAGGRYYPKLLGAVPFSPVPGHRLLVRPGLPELPLYRLLAEGMEAVAAKYELSSIHVNFLGETECAALESAGWLTRLGCQYHWQNDGYASFDDFLAALSSRKRKAIRKERKQVADSGLTLRQLTGADIRPEHWDAFYSFYMDTTGRKWGGGYLTRAFFEEIGSTMADRILLVIAEDEGVPVAGALNLIGSDILYGRNWGCLDSYKFLHFEACYYQAIDYAIAHGLKEVQAGAQGEHKIQRGYLPTPTYSAHKIMHPGFAKAVGDFLEHERPAMLDQIEALMLESPFRQDA